MKTITQQAVFLTFACFLATGVLRADDGKEQLRKTLESVARAQAAAIEAEDMHEYSKTFHSQSFTLAPSRNATEALLKSYDISVKVTKLALVGEDETFVYARVTIETRKKAGPAFRDNIVESIWAFKKEKTEWKFWSSGILLITYLD